MLLITLLLVTLGIAAETTEYFRVNPIGGGGGGSLHTSTQESEGLLGTAKLDSRVSCCLFSGSNAVVFGRPPCSTLCPPP